MIHTSVRIRKESRTRNSGCRFCLKNTDGLSALGAVRNKNTAPAIQIPEVTLYCTTTNCRRNSPHTKTASAASARIPVRSLRDRRSSLAAIRNSTPN